MWGDASCTRDTKQSSSNSNLGNSATLYIVILSMPVFDTHSENTKTQGFVNGDSLYVYYFPMTSESEAPSGIGVIHT